VARVTGESGERIQAWREQHDPEQARRIPPHATLCYWAPVVEPAILERQVRHAFDRPVCARLGQVRDFGNADGTFFVDVLETEALDAVRSRLHDGAFLELSIRPDWTWHVTCVRVSRGRSDIDLLRAAAKDLVIDAPWEIDTISYLELRGGRYAAIADWHVP